MATTIRIKRSVGNTAPTGLAQGELAYVEASGTGDGRLYIGAAGSTVEVVGGQYFIDIINNMVTNNINTLTVPASTTISAFAATLLDDTTQGAMQTTLGVDPAGTDNSTDVTLTGTPNYITIDVGTQVITVNQVDLATDVTGNLPVSNLGSGTGANATTFWRGDGTWATPAGSGDVSGPGAAVTDNNIVLWNGTSGTSVNDDGFSISDGALGSSSVVIPTSNAVKTYVDGLVSTPLNYKGALNATTPSPDLNSITSSVGDMYTVTVAGTINFTTGTDHVLEVGDVLIAEADGVLSNGDDWTVVQSNIGAASSTVAGYVELATSTEVTTGTDTTRAITPEALANGTIDGGTF